MNSEEMYSEVELHWKEKLKIESAIREFAPILMDDRKKGDNSAPTPVEMFLSSIGSCLAMAFVYCIYLSHIELNPEDFKVKVIGKLGRVDDRLRLIDIEAEFIIKAKSDNLKIQKCFEKFQPFCILSESIKAPISFKCDLKLEKKN